MREFDYLLDECIPTVVGNWMNTKGFKTSHIQEFENLRGTSDIELRKIILDNAPNIIFITTDRQNYFRSKRDGIYCIFIDLEELMTDYVIKMIGSLQGQDLSKLFISKFK